MPISGSTVVRRQLGRQLRRLRDAAKKTERDVEEAGLASRAKLWRIESGKTSIKIADVRTLCWLYGADQATTDALAALATGTSARGWWEDYSDALPKWFSMYVGLEAAASEIRIYESELVHGLLQTPAYIRAVHEAVYEARGDQVDEVAVQRTIKLRHERQQTVTSRTPPLRLTAVLGAGVLARQVGGKAVMKEQITQLREFDRLDHVDIRVMPWGAGGHAAMHIGEFAIFDFPDPDDPAVVYLESHTFARYLEEENELAEYRKIYESIYRKSILLEEYK